MYKILIPLFFKLLFGFKLPMLNLSVHFVIRHFPPQDAFGVKLPSPLPPIISVFFVVATVLFIIFDAIEEARALQTLAGGLELHDNAILHEGN